jgi:hypothetical protein
MVQVSSFNEVNADVGCFIARRWALYEWHLVKECLTIRCPEAEGAQSRRDGPIVAWHEVPGQRRLERAVP